ncbi:MAG: adenylate kinase [Kiritimatiellae bacterium]|nr:adenylate kinase [Kiritimatiellia bacterium]MBQ9344525.1 adenylate kinase [Kiritimatiellia bacterium]
MKAIVLLGAPGAGKGTLAEAVRDQAGFQHISTGDILRAAVRDQTPTGLEAKKFMDAGELVPDSVIMRLVEERIAQGGPEDKFMFDGFPRTLAQAEMFDATLAKLDASVSQVFLLEVSPEAIVKRLGGRRICRGCGAVYNIAFIPPKQDGVCDSCGGELYQRDDDKEATVLNRLEVYNRQTASLVDFYDKKGVLVRVNAAGTPQEAVRDMLSKLR